MSVDSVHGFTDCLIINSLIVEQISTTECFRGCLVYHFKHMFLNNITRNFIYFFIHTYFQKKLKIIV